jgi:hypothetical protein
VVEEVKKWWNKAIKELVHSKRDAFRKWLNSRTAEHKNDYRELSGKVWKKLKRGWEVFGKELHNQFSKISKRRQIDGVDGTSLSIKFIERKQFKCKSNSLGFLFVWLSKRDESDFVLGLIRDPGRCSFLHAVTWHSALMLRTLLQ